ncbi:MAG: hypothetical protein DA408_13385 [Bacteroidetes bacterium]|nr:MAG: hypothetical protein C7N36_11520 [Bacteroidota bacterium]PTM11494.1 MAG: hypothetical protein DA408_13385 [Bacteroidota bacterium]
MAKSATELAELQAAGIIDETTAQRIAAYWEQRAAARPNRLPLVFSLLGALLVGLGIILLVAHNWDQLNRFIKLLIAFLPVVLGQGAAWYAWQNRPENVAWREGSALFLFLATGACLAMVSQIYHLEGSLSSYLFTWIWVVLPVIYVLKSSAVSLFYWVGITWYATEAVYWGYPHGADYWYWFFALAAAPFYLWLRRTRAGSNFTIFHHWIIPLSLTIGLGTLYQQGQGGSFLWLGYQIFLVGLFLVGWASRYISGQQRLIGNGWLMVGLLGSIGMLLAQSFRPVWESMPAIFEDNGWQSRNFLVFAVIYATVIGSCIYLLFRRTADLRWHPLPYLGLLAPFIYIMGQGNPLLGAVIGNVFLLLLGVYHIGLGTQRDHLGILNFGLLIITAQIICRFFDTDLSFTVRGLLFLVVGAGFFLTNIYLIRRRQKTDHTVLKPEE